MIALTQEQIRMIGIAQPRRRLDHGIENRLQVGRRDGLEHLGGGGLPAMSCV
jgi:hypothetical protein